uniref:C2 domain-containing protein n=1 Tax=Trypanosoma congolense (strain IL3000) TaxID=1068625 RepID=G0V074_TRYCI|nr:conserved hypothetical protein [Trypanosoma congolense IL3000]
MEANDNTQIANVSLCVEILRGRNYPQSDDDPCACSTYVRAKLYDNIMRELIGAPFETPLQEGSNAPFYNTSACFEVPTNMETVVLVVQVVESSRRQEPYVMFHGSYRMVAVKPGKSDGIVFLIQTDPIEHPEKAEAEVNQARCEGLPCPTLSIRYQIKRQGASQIKEEDNSDVFLSSAPVLDGSCQIVPKNSQYVWFNIASDRQWNATFSNALVAAWRRHSIPSDGTTSGHDSPTKPSASGKSKEITKREPLLPLNINTVADVVFTQWNCCRLHQVLSWLRLSGEAYIQRQKMCKFSKEDVLNFRRERKKQIYLLQDMAISSLLSVGESKLRDTIEHLWVYYITGVSNDISSGTVLPYETRKRMKEAKFEYVDKLVIQSEFLNFLIPSLSREQCDRLVAADLDAAAKESESHDVLDKYSSVQSGSLHTSTNEIRFTAALLECVGAMLDTLTETEISQALVLFKPCVVAAHQRMKTVVRDKLRVNAVPEHERFTYRIGSGIKFAHLDRLGRRKKEINLR